MGCFRCASEEEEEEASWLLLQVGDCRRKRNHWLLLCVGGMIGSKGGMCNRCCVQVKWPTGRGMELQVKWPAGYMKCRWRLGQREVAMVAGR